MFPIFEEHPWLLPVVIFFGRICDVTLGTLRIIFVSKGERYKAPIVGFFEVFIWVVIISQIFSHANSLISYLAYAAGYASGNYVGILVENKIAFGFQLLRVYTKQDCGELVRALNKKNIGATVLMGEGAVSPVHIIEIVIDRKLAQDVIDDVIKHDSKAFYIIEDIRTKEKGIFALKSTRPDRIFSGQRK